MTKQDFVNQTFEGRISDHFEPTNILFIDRDSHNSDDFINKYMEPTRVNPCPPLMYNNVPNGK